MLRAAAASAALVALRPGAAWAEPAEPAADLILRPIPGREERLPVIGMGTSRTFDVADDAAAREKLLEVLRAFFAAGGEVIDTSPMYGTAEQVLGDLLARVPDRRLFAATKVWTDGREEGIEQMDRSLRRIGLDTIDLMQIHNLRDWANHLPTLRDWKERGKIRYLGVTTSHGRAHDELERLLREHRFDFVQLSYSIGARAVEDRLLPLAADRGTAVLVNRPFERGEVFDRVKGKEVPPWAADELGCGSWGQFFLKFAASHPAVTCAIPATGNPRHMADNMGAARGRLPNARERERMLAFWESL